MLNIDKLLIDEYKAELDKLDKSDFSDLKSYETACLTLAKKSADITINFVNASLANFVACNTRALDSQKAIARYVWDFENMNFN